MDKDDILERAKKENLINDEAKNNKRQKGQEWGSLAALAVAIAFGFIFYFNNKDVYHIVAILGAYCGVKGLVAYYLNREKSDLYLMVGGLLLFVSSSIQALSDIWNF